MKAGAASRCSLQVQPPGAARINHPGIKTLLIWQEMLAIKCLFVSVIKNSGRKRIQLWWKRRERGVIAHCIALSLLTNHHKRMMMICDDRRTGEFCSGANTSFKDSPTIMLVQQNTYLIQLETRAKIMQIWVKIVLQYEGIACADWHRVTRYFDGISSVIFHWQ